MSKLLIDERPLTVLPSLVALVGMERAVILQQIHWLSQQKNTGVVLDDGERWVWGTNEEWCDEYFTFWKADTLRKHLKRLEKDGYIFTCQPNGFNRTNHYRVNYENLESPIRHDRAASKRHKRTTSIRHDDAASNRHDDTTSKRNDDAASKRHDDPASYKEKTSTETSTETTQKRDVGLTPTPHPDVWEDFLFAFCWVCHNHQDLKALTEAQFGALSAEGKRLCEDGYTKADLRNWMDRHWFEDWRWKNGRQRPRPDEVRSMIPVIRNATGYEVNPRFVADNQPIGAQPSVAATTAPSGPWAQCLQELKLTMTAATFAWLRDSEMVAAGHIPIGDGNAVPLYKVFVEDERAVGWLAHQATKQIQRRLASILGHPVQIEIVLSTKEPEAA